MERSPAEWGWRVSPLTRGNSAQASFRLPELWVALWGGAGPGAAYITSEKPWALGRVLFCVINHEVAGAEVLSMSSEFCLLEALLSEGDLLVR